MDSARDPFAPLSEAELAGGARQSEQPPDDQRAKPICPPPNAESGVLAAGRLFGRKPDGAWRYETAEGETAFHALRWNEPDGKKTFRPLSWCGGDGWQFVAWPSGRPVYNLGIIVQQPGAPIIVCEGEKAADAAARIFPKSIVTTSSGGAAAASKTNWSALAGRDVLIWPDCDLPGDKYAREVAAKLAAHDCSVAIVDAEALASIDPDGGPRKPREKWDAADAVAEWPDLVALCKAAHGLAKPLEPEPTTASVQKSWPAPKPLPDGLLPVAPFDYGFLPEPIARWVKDISERMQCPPDFVGAAAMVALGATIGRKVGIRPQRKTDWQEVPNMWGCVIGRPGAMKSPAMAEALKPLNRLEAQARQENDEKAKAFANELEAHKIAKEDAAKRIRAALKRGETDVSHLLPLEPERPKAGRYLVNDCTYEALGAILADNPNGVLAFRDELVSLLKTLDREEYAAARGFFLTAWNGTSGYTFDRIIRGRVHIEAACLSLLGSTQPGRIAEYIRRASGGVGDDGLIQRFGLLIWPDQSPEWRNVDRYPDSAARATAFETFTRLDAFDPDANGCERDLFDPLPFFRFDDVAQGLFEEWRFDLESRLRSDNLSPALESHLSKYRKLVPGLALICHLADGSGPIGKAAVLQSLAFVKYLETHARRTYGAAGQAEAASAKAILSRIRRGELEDCFTVRDIYRREWANLSDREQVQVGLDLLTDCDWLQRREIPTGGRPRTTYVINPRGGCE